MKTLPTQGDWKIYGGVILADTLDGLKQIHAIYQEDDKGNRIRSEAEDEANARLIEAAPRMLAVLKDVAANLGVEAFRRNDHVGERLDDSRRRIDDVLSDLV